jgi:hypothetical protein
MLAVCRTNESLGLPAGTRATRLEGSGFYWYVVVTKLDSEGWRECDRADCQSLALLISRSCPTRRYDTGQSHIITNAEFRNCGVRSNNFAQYDSSPTRGCPADDDAKGCSDQSTVFGLLSGSDEFTPEVMQGTRAIKFSSCGRRFRYTSSADTVAARGQNWLDADGSISGTNSSTMVGSGLVSASSWWRVDDEGRSEVERERVPVYKADF